eukprot:6506-Prymnesium_polylepis.2
MLGGIFFGGPGSVQSKACTASKSPLSSAASSNPHWSLDPIENRTDRWRRVGSRHKRFCSSPVPEMWAAPTASEACDTLSRQAGQIYLPTICQETALFCQVRKSEPSSTPYAVIPSLQRGPTGPTASKMLALFRAGSGTRGRTESAWLL